jgi:hypothetical protein
MSHYSTASEEIKWWINKMVLWIGVVAEMKCLNIHEGTITTTSINITDIHQSKQWKEKN